MERYAVTITILVRQQLWLRLAVRALLLTAPAWGRVLFWLGRDPLADSRRLAFALVRRGLRYEVTV